MFVSFLLELKSELYVLLDLILLGTNQNVLDVKLGTSAQMEMELALWPAALEVTQRLVRLPARAAQQVLPAPTQTLVKQLNVWLVLIPLVHRQNVPSVLLGSKFVKIFKTVISTFRLLYWRPVKTENDTCFLYTTYIKADSLLVYNFFIII